MILKNLETIIKRAIVHRFCCLPKAHNTAQHVCGTQLWIYSFELYFNLFIAIQIRVINTHKNRNWIVNAISVILITRLPLDCNSNTAKKMFTCKCITEILLTFAYTRVFRQLKDTCCRQYARQTIRVCVCVHI